MEIEIEKKLKMEKNCDSGLDSDWQDEPKRGESSIEIKLDEGSSSVREGKRMHSSASEAVLSRLPDCSNEMDSNSQRRSQQNQQKKKNKSKSGAKNKNAKLKETLTQLEQRYILLVKEKRKLESIIKHVFTSFPPSHNDNNSATTQNHQRFPHELDEPSIDTDKIIALYHQNKTDFLFQFKNQLALQKQQYEAQLQEQINQVKVLELRLSTFEKLLKEKEEKIQIFRNMQQEKVLNEAGSLLLQIKQTSKKANTPNIPASPFLARSQTMSTKQHHSDSEKKNKIHHHQNINEFSNSQLPPKIDPSHFAKNDRKKLQKRTIADLRKDNELKEAEIVELKNQVLLLQKEALSLETRLQPPVCEDHGIQATEETPSPLLLAKLKSDLESHMFQNKSLQETIEKLKIDFQVRKAYF